MNNERQKIRPLIVGISGASGSGKSLLSQNLKDSFPTDFIQVISEDNYYLDQSHLNARQRESVNYDHPDAIDHGLLYEHVLQMQTGASIEMPNYDFSLHSRSEAKAIIRVTPIIVIEGIMLFTHAKLREAMDLKFFVDTPLDICLLRRIQRDTLERGRSIESVIQQYESSVRSGYIEHIAPTRQYADLIIPRGGNNAIALDLIQARFRAHQP